MQKFNSESGVQLAGRIRSVNRPKLEHLDLTIFPSNGPYPKEIAEISGDTGTGKTTLLMNIMARVILPLSCNGKGGMILFLLTDNNFDYPKFLKILERYIRDSDLGNESETNVQNILEISLENITFRRCFNSLQFELGILDLNQTFSNNNQYSMVALDSIGAFYWSEISDRSKMRMNIYMKNILMKLTRIIDEHHLVLVYTKPAYMLQNASIANDEFERINYFMELIGGNEDESSDEVTRLVYTVHMKKT